MSNKNSIDIPEGLFYTQEHEWIRFNTETGEAEVGITAFATDALGDLVYVEIDVVEGETIDDGCMIGTIEAVKSVSDLFTPQGGEVISINQELEDEPELISADPYKHWILKIKTEFKEGANDELLTPDQYKEIIGQ